MKYCIFSENEWTYPDSQWNGKTTAHLHAARGGDACFQLLTDFILLGGEPFSFQGPSFCEFIIYQLLPAHVGENSGPKSFTTLDFESVKSFVTRPAPFDVYDITRPLDNKAMEKGRCAFYVRIKIPQEATPGLYDITLRLKIGLETLSIPLTLTVYQTQIPSVSSSSFHMCNWIQYDSLAHQHQVALWSEPYFKLLEAYLENQRDMRNDYLMLPSGEPVRDQNGAVIDFDFTNASKVGALALQHGFLHIMGGFVARFHQWDESEHYLLWDKETGVTSTEGYRQLKLYFTKAWQCVLLNGWQQQYMQCLVDEPQFPNSLAYRALSCICRKCMPGIQIHDPVETTDIAGAVDVWVVKQTVYETYLKTYQQLQEMGEELWTYTCGFPAGATMNRAVDLPLTVSRLPMWMCYKYGLKGFLHWGYLLHNQEVEKETCYKVEEGIKYPPGNSFIVYPGDGRPWYSVRGHAQRAGACDFELFTILGRQNKQQALELIEAVCHTFDDYHPSAERFDEVHRQLLERLG